MGNLVEFAKEELNRLGMGEDDRTGEDIDYCMRDHILRMVKEFEDEDHSGLSASYSLSILKRLLAFKPLSPLTGSDDEWTDVYVDNDGNTIYQNKRYGSVFKGPEGAYDIDGIVLWEWFTNDDGTKEKIYFTSSESVLPVKFPYTPAETPTYKFRPTDEDPNEELTNTHNLTQ